MGRQSNRLVPPNMVRAQFSGPAGRLGTS
jgi:hypothetical protein